MRHSLLLICLLGLSLNALAQNKKFQFGFLAKAGNFTLPNAALIDDYDLYWSHVTNRHKLGFQQSLGVFATYKLSEQFQITSECSFRFITSKHRKNWEYQFFDSIGIIRETAMQVNKTQITSLVLPIMLQYSPEKLPKLQFRLGGGMCHNLSAKSENINTYSFGETTDVEYRFENNTNQWHSSDFRFQFTAGIGYQISPNTSIGLEYQQEKSYQQYFDSYFNSNPFIDIAVYSTYIPRMHSFSVSLRHNLLL